jgi:hypothetical protein
VTGDKTGDKKRGGDGGRGGGGGRSASESPDLSADAIQSGDIEEGQDSYRLYRRSVKALLRLC